MGNAFLNVRLTGAAKTCLICGKREASTNGTLYLFQASFLEGGGRKARSPRPFLWESPAYG
jgi:hypothetical protein